MISWKLIHVVFCWLIVRVLEKIDRKHLGWWPTFLFIWWQNSPSKQTTRGWIKANSTVGCIARTKNLCTCDIERKQLRCGITRSFPWWNVTFHLCYLRKRKCVNWIIYFKEHMSIYLFINSSHKPYLSFIYSYLFIQM